LHRLKYHSARSSGGAFLFGFLGAEGVKSSSDFESSPHFGDDDLSVSVSTSTSTSTSSS
jgi:hypothetical protein